MVMRIAMRHTALYPLFCVVLFALLAVFLSSTVVRAGGAMANPERLDSGTFNGSDLRLSNSAYILGKSIYQGRGKKVPGLGICLSVYDEETDAAKAVRLSRKELRPFRGQHITALTSRLVDCEAPTSQVALILSRTEFRALVYFMNKKFRLRLKS
jgi:hypothetical protein